MLMKSQGIGSKTNLIHKSWRFEKQELDPGVLHREIKRTSSKNIKFDEGREKRQCIQEWTK